MLAPKFLSQPTDASAAQLPLAARRAAELTRAALELGFCSIGFTPATPLPEAHAAWRRWLDAGQHGDMAFMAAHARRDDPGMMLPAARTLVVVALPYGRDSPAGTTEAPPALRGFVGRYARGADYHQVLRQRLEDLAAICRKLWGPHIDCRPCVDSAPLLERGYAARAGVGFAAKNTLSIVPGSGSYVLLGELLVDVELAPSAPAKARCGGCTACMRACPTGAFVGPHVLDARRCISYLTIELRGPIPRALRPLMGNMVFGCDICQEVCPFNASPKPRLGDAALRGRADLAAPDLVFMLQMGAAAYRRFVAGTSLRRASRPMLARNAAVALGNSGAEAAMAPLAQALASNRFALVRGHAAWALGQLGGEMAAQALRDAIAHETDPWVQEEIALASKSATTGA